ncbi:MAG: choice-of-anchor D domain-containing protein [Phycisphaeraceae bacterium]
MPSLVCLPLVFAVTAIPLSQTQAQAPQAPPADAPIQAEAIRNPYYPTRQWKLWSQDDSPVTDPTLLGDNKTVVAPPVEKHLWPADPDTAQPGQFMRFVNHDDPNRPYAGIWDDVYSSQDARHSYIQSTWDVDPANKVSIAASHIHFVQGRQLGALGVNFTSQSTTGMGHDIANSDRAMLDLESRWYFADVLRAGPAHTSMQERGPSSTSDAYQALVPTFYNSMGSSGGETWGLMKMVIAGGYLPRTIKPELKRHGLYPAAMLYIWKAALPYDVPYDHELRHRVAYFSKGNHSDYRGPTRVQINKLAHGYDETAHMRNMVALAKSMDVPPPVAILRSLDVTGGQTVYAHKTAMLVQQHQGEPVRIRISAADCYDLMDRPLTCRWKVLYGNKNTTIVKDTGDATYTITVPWDDKLPRGRTSILLVANNGEFDSNPAIVNVHRTAPYKDDRGRARNHLAENLRPELPDLADQVILPGEELTVPITAVDPEGFPVTLYRWAGEVGEMDGSVFRWRCPPDQKPGRYPVTLIASDGTSGYSLNSGRFHVEVSPIIAKLTVDRPRGTAPLAVRFNSAGSRDIAMTGPTGRLTYHWDFADATTSQEPSPAHTFTQPGFYPVTLTVRGPSGNHTARHIVEVLPDWALVLNNGWGRAPAKGDDGKDTNVTKIDEQVWTTFDPYRSAWVRPESSVLGIRKPREPKLDAEAKQLVDQKAKDGQPLFRMESVADFAPPFHVEAVYFRMSDYTKAPSGFDVLGAVIDQPAGLPDGQWQVGVGYPTGEVTKDRRGQESPVWNSLVIGEKVRFPWTRSRLRLFVENDPNHAGKLRYTGYLDTDMGRHFFRADNMKQVHSKIAIVSAEPATLFEIDQFHVWAPTGKSVAGPEVNPLGRDGFSLCGSAAWMQRDNGTDFGWPDNVGGSVRRTFTLRNDGSDPLTIESLDIPGPHAGEFAVTAMPPAQIGSRDSAAFTVTFTPAGPGKRTARIRIASNDPDEKLLDVDMLGRGAQPARINVEGNGLNTPNGQNAPNATNHTDFGQAPVKGGTVTRTFLVQNLGHEPLDLLQAVQITGPHASEFTVVAAPPKRVDPLGSRRLTIRWQPTAPGPRNAVVTITSNDEQKPTYTFAIQGHAH